MILVPQDQVATRQWEQADVVNTPQQNAISPSQSKLLLEQCGLVVGYDEEIKTRVIGILSETIPLSALQLVVHAGTYWNIGRNADELGVQHKNVPQRYGMEPLHWDTQEIALYECHSHEVAVLMSHYRNDEHLRTALVHETMHALDHALGQGPDDFRTDDELWCEIYERAWERTRAFGEGFGFPTEYAQESRRELFAECACLYLCPHVRYDGNKRLERGCEDLLRALPEAHEALQELFNVELPELARHAMVPRR